MRFTLTQEQEKFHEEVREFLIAEMKAGTFSTSTASGGLIAATSREFSRKMAERGWIGLTWPKKYGGQGRTYVDKMIMMEELFKVKAPIGYHFMADRQVGPALIIFGSDWQKDYFLPRIVKAEEGASFCLLFSEPNAGSDLASVSTKAEKDGDSYVINGQKVWTSEGHFADWGWLLAKTDFDPSVPKHKACSEFVVDLKSPGVTIRPIINIVGEHSFNEVFFDNVRVSKDCLVGKENDGFKQIMAQLDYERAGIERVMQNYPIYDRLISTVKNLDKDRCDPGYYHWVRDSMAQLEVEFQAGRLLCYYTAWIVDQGKKPTSQAALCKAYCTLYEQRLNDLATRILGPVSQIKKGTEWAPCDVDVADSYLWGPSYTLQGGSVEVLKNIVAQRGLGL